MDHHVPERFQGLRAEQGGGSRAKQFPEWAQCVSDFIQLTCGLTVTPVMLFGKEPVAEDHLADGKPGIVARRQSQGIPAVCQPPGDESVLLGLARLGAMWAEIIVFAVECHDGLATCLVEAVARIFMNQSGHMQTSLGPSRR